MKKRKIIAIAIIGMFLLTGLTTLSAVGIEADVSKQTLNEKTALINSNTKVYLGHVKILSDGTYDGTIITIDYDPSIEKIISGKTTIQYYITYEIDFHTINGLGTASVGFHTLTVHTEINNGVDINLENEDHREGELVSKELEVEKGDKFAFEIHGTYCNVFPVFCKPELRIGKGKYIGRGRPKLIINPTVIQPIGKTKYQILDQIQEKIVDRFPILEKIIGLYLF